MKVLNNVWFWFLLFLIALFFVTYFMLSYGIDMLMGNKVYGESLTVSASVEGLPVGPNYQDQLTAPPRYVQPAPNVIQPEFLPNAKFIGVR